MVKKTIYKSDWGNGTRKIRTLSRSFKTLDEAERFASGKQVTDIYMSKGLVKVEWTKVIPLTGDNSRYF